MSESIPESQPSDLVAALPALHLNDVVTLSHSALLEKLEESGLRARREASRYALVFDLARGLLAGGTRVTAEAVLDTSGNQTMLRWAEANFLPGPIDIALTPRQVSSQWLRSGLKILGTLRLPEGRERHLIMESIEAIERVPAAEWSEPADFEKLTAMFPTRRIFLEHIDVPSVSARAADLISPLGMGQRGLIVAPPRAGKTFLLKALARGIQANHPEIALIVLLVDERPEEVTDMRRELHCEIYSSTFDESPTRHIAVAELVCERAKRLVELKKDVVILLDSITRLSRGYNNLQPSKGRIMSGGVDSKALAKPKRFFGAARNVEEGGSLTILATALVETQSRMDDLIFEEFKGTGNMEIHLDRSIAEQRIFPAIHVVKSATRRDELLLHPDELARVVVLRKQLSELPAAEAMEVLAENLMSTRSNAELLLKGLRGA